MRIPLASWIRNQKLRNCSPIVLCPFAKCRKSFLPFVRSLRYCFELVTHKSLLQLFFIDRNAVKTLKHFNLPRDDTKEGPSKKNSAPKKDGAAKHDERPRKKMGRPPKDRSGIVIDLEKKKRKLVVDGVKKKIRRGPITDEDKLEMQRKRMAIAREALRKKREARLLEAAKTEHPETSPSSVEAKMPSYGASSSTSVPSKPGSPVQLKILPFSSRLMKFKMKEKRMLRKVRRRERILRFSSPTQIETDGGDLENIQKIKLEQVEELEPINLDEDDFFSPRLKRTRWLSSSSTRSSSVSTSPVKKPNDLVAEVLPNSGNVNTEEMEEHAVEEDLQENLPAEPNIRVLVDVPPSLATILVRDKEECCRVEVRVQEY